MLERTHRTRRPYLCAWHHAPCRAGRFASPSVTDYIDGIVDIERILGDLQKAMAELEGLLGQGTERLQEPFGETAERLRERFDAARAHLATLQTEIGGGVKRAAKVADESVRNNPWSSILIAAAAAFVLGFALARSESSGPEQNS